MKKCKRNNCLLYCEDKSNNCNALSHLYLDDNKCPFFKESVENKENKKEEK